MILNYNCVKLSSDWWILYFFVDDVTLEELEENNLDLLDWVCTRLDNGKSGFRQDYERLAAKYKLISPEVRKSLKNEFKSEGGSPSKMLMNQLQTL